MSEIKSKIQAILLNNSQKSVIGWSVEEEDFEIVSNEILELVKKSNVRQSLSDQRELLKAFKDKLTPALEIDVGFDYISDEDIEDCLKEFNSC